MLLNALGSSQKEIEELARAETDPDQYSRFAPICRGPAFAAAVIVFAGLISLPALLVGTILSSLRREGRGGLH